MRALQIHLTKILVKQPPLETQTALRLASTHKGKFLPTYLSVFGSYHKIINTELTHSGYSSSKRGIITHMIQEEDTSWMK